MLKLRKDAINKCSTCDRMIPVSQVVRWTYAQRAWWFITGQCVTCQDDNKDPG